MLKTNISRGMEILMLLAVLGLTACGGGGGSGSTGSTSPSSTTSGSGGSTTATSIYTLSWDAVTGTTTVTGYRVYYGTAPLANQPPLGMIDTTVTSVDFSPGQYKIAAGTTLYMAVSALGTNGVESPVSQTVSVVVQ